MASSRAGDLCARPAGVSSIHLVAIANVETLTKASRRELARLLDLQDLGDRRELVLRLGPVSPSYQTNRGWRQYKMEIAGKG